MIELKLEAIQISKMQQQTNNAKETSSQASELR